MCRRVRVVGRLTAYDPGTSRGRLAGVCVYLLIYITNSCIFFPYFILFRDKHHLKIIIYVHLGYYMYYAIHVCISKIHGSLLSMLR